MSRHQRFTIRRRLAAAACLCGMAAAGAAHAQTAPQPAPAAAAQGSGDLGRLFYTPQQRAELDKRRISNVPVQEEAPVVREVLVTVNGYVGRSSGKTTTWINGVPQYDTVKSADPARVPVESAEGRKTVKVGSTLDTNRGDVRDVIGDGTIRVNPAPTQR